LLFFFDLHYPNLSRPQTSTIQSITLLKLLASPHDLIPSSEHQTQSLALYLVQQLEKLLDAYHD
jgi:hypothetical protein